MKRCAALSCVVFLSGVMFSGCGRGQTTVLLTGRIAGAEQFFANTQACPLQVTLLAAGTPEDAAAGLSFSALIDPDGGFVIEGAEGHGIPPGTYTITVTSTAYGDLIPQLEQEEQANPFGPQVSPLSYEVTADKGQSILIDLSTRTVQREK
jgi:hypothetical protein